MSAPQTRVDSGWLLKTKAREKGAASYQYIAFADTETGECGERRLNHGDGEAKKFYEDLRQRGINVRVSMEATGFSGWFERLLAELGI